MPGGWEWLIIIGVLLLLFGAKRLPDMARSVGQSARVFKGEMKGLKEDGKDGKDETPATVEAPAPLPQAQPPVAEQQKVTQPGSTNAGQ
ncbi:MAG: Sec-independent protein translocase subunit TatA [Pseudonocardia sp.]|jgi:sec-independent protein translocase protein TatA|uniref:Sec-independent protein translocase subunit TatA n=1 Tax=Pseudonocardia sp. TaxID=60912 RepID=UPI001AC3815E|nr:Sec-independent protein translocase subunit TatA [Pseudonocardia sp.]MBN9101639.1 Sec-independent protein translocase subunit TatA [Pseudonocardia sp.]